MKKISIALVLLLTAGLFISCGKSSADENGIFQELNPAMEYAKKKNQDVIIAVTLNGDDEYSADVINNVMNTKAFKDEIASKYAVIHMDFSQSAYEKTVVSEDATKEAQAAAAKNAEIMQQNSLLAATLNVQATPSFYIFTKDQYYLTQLDPMDGTQSYQTFKANLDSKADLIADMHKKIDATKKGSVKDRIAAIDTFCDSVDMTYTIFYADMYEYVIENDKKNESGLLSKYLLADADARGSIFYMNGNPVAAAQAYVDVCSNPMLEAAHKQQAYYMASYILAMTDTGDYQTLLDYLQKAIDADPENPEVPSIRAIYDNIVQMVEAYGLESEAQ